MSKHTAGPWRVTRSSVGPVLVAHAEDTVSSICSFRGEGINANREANALLIAAAPELFSALSDALEALCSGEHYSEAIAKANAALAKAEGIK
jgi:hypothetical protein